ELLVGQPFDDEAGAALRRVHDRDIDASLDEPLHQVLLEADLGTDRDVRRRLTELGETRQQQSFPDTDAAADRQRRAESLRDPGILPRALDRAEQRRRVLLEHASGRRQRRAGLVALEQAASELLLERLDPCADRRLRNAEFLRGLDEVAGGDDGKERACELGIHFETAWFERRRFGSSALEVNFARRARIVRATRCSSSKRSKTRIEFID